MTSRPTLLPDIEVHVPSSKPVRHDPPSVADLRKSFEQNSHQSERSEVPKEIYKVRDSLSNSVQNLLSEIDNCGMVATVDSMVREDATPLDPSANNTTVAESGARFMHKMLQSAFDDSTSLVQRVRQDLGPLRLTPTSLPKDTSSSSKSVLTLKTGSFEPHISPESTLELDDDGSKYTAQLCGDLKTCPYSSPVHPLLLCKTDQRGTTNEPSLGHLDEHISSPSLTINKPGRPSRELGTQTDLSYPSPVNLVVGKDYAARWNGKVADLRRLFDRSSPSAFMSFDRRQRQTLPGLSTAHLNSQSHEVSEPSTSLRSSPVSQTTSSPPALTTVISVDDFACSFVDGGHQQSHSNATARPHLEPHSDSSPPVTHESPLKDRINHFEHLHSRSQSYDTGAQDELRSGSLVPKQEMPIAVTPKATNNRHPVHSVWRRISQTLTHFSDGSRETHEHYGSSYQTYSASIELSRSPPSRTIFPLLPARKSFPLMQRFSSGGTGRYIFDLDGANQSVAHVPDAAVFTNGPKKAASNETPQVLPSLLNVPRDAEQERSSFASERHSSVRDEPHRTFGGLPKGSELLKQVSEQDRARQKHEKKINKIAAREERRKRVANRKHSKIDATKVIVKHTAKERQWDKHTSGGFVVREAGLTAGDMREPKPHKPGQVKKVLNYSKEKSTSLLRIVSGGHYGGSKEKLGGENESAVHTPGTIRSLRKWAKGKEKARPSNTMQDKGKVRPLSANVN